jgi:hypothetical protein
MRKTDVPIANLHKDPCTFPWAKERPVMPKLKNVAGVTYAREH